MAQHEVALIGAGPVGLGVAKALAEAQIPYVQLEATDHVGGNWAHGVYETAHIISSRRTTEFPDFPMPTSYPDFPSAPQMCAYYEAFTDAHGLRPAIRFQSPVQAVRPRDDGRWDVTVGDGDPEVFKAVVVCNGHHWQRSYPSWVSQFGGEVLHSKDYKRPDQLRGKRVLVLGGGNSGVDLACEASRVGVSCDWSLRRGYWFLPKTVLGRPSVDLIRPWVPVAVQRAMMKGLLRLTVGDYARYGLPEPDHDLFEAHPTVSSQIFDVLAHGKIQVRPDVADVDGCTVRFRDGTSGTYDLVACGTGFDLAFPFLPDGMVPVEGKVALLYGGMTRPAWRHLWVLGTTQPRYGLGPLVRPAAVLLAKLIALQDEVEVPLGAVFEALGDRPARTHLQDPMEVLRRIRQAERAMPLLRWRARRLDAAHRAARAR